MTKYKPTDSELEILQILWERGPCSVREVNDNLNKKRKVVYTTTLKFMQIMTEKGLLSREKKKLSHIYSSRIPRTEIQQDLVNNFLDKVFRGSASSLMMHALGSGKTTAAELEKIKQIISEFENQNKGGEA